MKRIFLLMIFSNLNFYLLSSISEIFLLPISVEESSLMSTLESVSEDNNSVFYNPAGIAMNNIKKINLNYGMLFDNMKSGSVVYISSFKDTAYSLGIKYYDLGAMEFFDDTGTKTGDKNLSARSIILGLSKEMFISGLYCGLSFGTRNISLNKEYRNILSRLGVICIFPINETELHFGVNTSVEYNMSDKVEFLPSLGLRYFLPEYDTFFLISHRNIKDVKFYGVGLEVDFIKDINMTFGYEVVEQKNGFLNNFGVGIKFNFIKKYKFDLGVGFKSGGILGYIFSTSLSFKL